MIVAGVREFRDNATEMLRSEEPVLVVRRGEVTGIYFPYPAQTLPVEFKRELFALITQEIGRKLQKAGIREEELLDGVKKTKKTRSRR
jgi:hypothetical protein